MTRVNKNKQKKRRTRAPPKSGSTFRQFPDSMNVAIKYSTRINYSSSAFNIYNLSMSSLQTFQGFMRDQLMLLFTNYVVLGFTVRYKIMNTSTSGVSAEVFDFNAPSTVTSGLALAQVLEWPSTRKHTLTYLGNTSTINITKHYDLSAIYKKDITSDSDFWGTASAAPGYANPEEHALGIYSVNGSDTVTLLIDREYVFHTRFFRRANPGNSLTIEAPILASFPEKPKTKQAKKKVVVSDSD